MKIVIAGAGAVGTYLSKMFSRDHQDCILIDNNEEKLSGLESEYDIMTMHADPTSIMTLKEAGVSSADLFVAVTASEAVNISCCAFAHELGAKKTVARIDDYEYLAPSVKYIFDHIGIDRLIYPEVMAAEDIVNGLKMSWVRQRIDIHGGALVLLGVKLRETATILNRPLKDICGPDDPYHVVAIKRAGDTLIPGGYDELRVLDLVYIMTTKEYIPYIRQLVGKEHYADVKNVIIMGGSKTAVRTAIILPDYMNAKIIERDGERCEVLNQLLDEGDIMVIHGDGRDRDLLAEEGIKNTQAFVALTGNTEANILACLTAKALGVRKTVAMVDNMDYVSMAEGLDIGTIVNKQVIAASGIYQMLIDAEVSNMRFLMTVEADVAEMTAVEGSRVTKKKVKDLGLPFGVTIGGLVRHGVGILVNGNTQIEAGDCVMVYCHSLNLKKIEKYFK